MGNVRGFEWMILAFFALVIPAVVALGIYAVVRLGVRHGRRDAAADDARRAQPPTTPGSPSTPAG